jgi:hypothetical protein
VSIDPSRVAILTVHGNGPDYTGKYANQYAWPRLQMAQLRRHTPQGYTVLAYGNAIISEHEAYLRTCPEVELRTSAEPLLRSFEHAWPIRNWLLRQAHRRFDYLITLDSDAFPVADGWLDRTLGLLTDDSPVVAVQRIENGDSHSDRCFMAFTSPAWRAHQFDFSPMGSVDAGGGISAQLEADHLGWTPLPRSNVWNPHQLTAGMYDDCIYHHAAGTRLPHFRCNHALWDTEEWPKEVLLHRGLMHLLFDDPEDFMARLRGLKSGFTEDAILAAGRQVRALETA